MKLCNKCNENKDISFYYKDKTTKTGYSGSCKLCSMEKVKLYYRTLNGLCDKINKEQESNRKKKNKSLPKYSRLELKNWIINNSKFKELFIIWEQSNYNKLLIPSIDRINPNIGYEFGNIQVLTWEENNNKGKYEKKYHSHKNIQCTNIETKEVTIYNTLREASLATNTNTSSISRCINGKLTKTKKYLWKRLRNVE